MASSFRLGLIQLSVCQSKAQNLAKAAARVKEAVSKGASIVSLPECFNTPYGHKYFPDYAEAVPDGESCKALKAMAQENKVYVIGGSIPERDGDKLFNTATVWSPEGELIAKHRKVHLFDIDIPGGITFKESESLSPGNDFTTFTTPFGKVGVGICYDVRFAELAQIYANEGCNLIIYPGAFNMTTGPAHWELLARSRALDNQVFVATVSPARDEKADYVAWGHSTLVDPFGKVLAKAGHDDELLVEEVNMEYLQQVRNQIPIRKQKRTDLYQVKRCK